MRVPIENFRSATAVSRFFLICLIGLGLDLWSKNYAFAPLAGWKWPGRWQLLSYPGAGREVFPFIFNVADVLLCVGVGLMIVYSLFSSSEKEKKKAQGEEVARAARP